MIEAALTIALLASLTLTAYLWRALAWSRAVRDALDARALDHPALLRLGYRLVREPPPPKPGHGDVSADVLAMIAESHPYAAAVIADRRAVGLATYGRPLRYDDGRGEIDAAHEAADLVLYLVRDGAPEEDVAAALDLLERVARRVSGAGRSGGSDG